MGRTMVRIDAVDELRLRRWARENYVTAEQRSSGWHAVVFDEMKKRDAELAGQGCSVVDTVATGIMYPLAP